MTAQDRVYFSLAANHDPFSGNISTNHSCKTGGNLFHLSIILHVNTPANSLRQDFGFEKREV